MKIKSIKKAGFTLVELMVALIVASIVLAAVSTLAGATTAAHEATDQMGREQAALRQLSMRLTDLIRRANQVTNSSDSGFELWHDNNSDGLLTSDELTQVNRGDDGNQLTIGSAETYTNCQSVGFGYDSPATNTQFIMISFYITENGQPQKYAVNARLRL